MVWRARPHAGLVLAFALVMLAFALWFMAFNRRSETVSK